MGDTDAQIAAFQNITASDTQTARFYLESNNWNLDAAISTFFATGDDSSVAQHAKPPAPQQQVYSKPPANEPKEKPKPPVARSKQSGAIKTLGEIKGSHDSDSEEEQDYYAGGAKSGQVVRSGAKKPSADQIANEIFKSAKEHGAEETNLHSDKTEAKPAFEGTGFRLGTGAGPSMPDPSTVKKAAQETKDRKVTITFWKQGFTVDDGPLRKFDDPSNKPFLDDIHAGVVPRELEQSARGQKLEVNLVNSAHQEWTPPKVESKPFQGSGQKLGTGSGAPVPQAVQTNNTPVTPPSQPVDASRPVTSIQIRLADGTRMVAKFNQDQTVQDLRTFIDMSRPGASKNWQLQTSFAPVQVFSNPSQTLKDAGLLNAAVVQKML